MPTTKIIVKTIPGFLSFSECKEGIAFYADSIVNEEAPTLLENKGRISSLRALIDLFEQYHNKIIEKEDE